MEGWQHHLVVFQLCRPVWRRWIDLAIIAGKLTPPADMPRGAVYRVDWIPQSWPYIHPVQDVEGKTKEIQAGLSSRSKKVAEAGYDAEAIDKENAADNERADDLGLSYTSDGRKAAKTGTAAADDPPTQPEPEPEPPTNGPEE